MNTPFGARSGRSGPAVLSGFALAISVLASAPAIGATWSEGARFPDLPPQLEALNVPTNVASDGAGKLYVLDKNNQRVVVFSEGGAVLSHWPFHTVRQNQVIYPWLFGLSALRGEVYLADNTNIYVYSTAGTLLGWSGVAESIGADYLSSMSVDPSGILFVTAQAHDGSSYFSDVYRIDPSSWATSRVLRSTAGLTYGGIAADAAWLYLWRSDGKLVRANRQGAVTATSTQQFDGWVQFMNADSSSLVVNELTKIAVVDKSTLARTASFPVVLGKSGSGMDNPRGLCMRGSKVYVADARNHRIAVVSSGGVYQGQITGPAPAVDHWLDGPADAVVDPATGDLFIVEQVARRVSRWTRNGAFLSSTVMPGLAMPLSIGRTALGDVLVGTYERLYRLAANGTLQSYLVPATPAFVQGTLISASLAGHTAAGEGVVLLLSVSWLDGSNVWRSTSVLQKYDASGTRTFEKDLGTRYSRDLGVRPSVDGTGTIAIPMLSDGLEIRDASGVRVASWRPPFTPPTWDAGFTDATFGTGKLFVTEESFGLTTVSDVAVFGLGGQRLETIGGIGFDGRRGLLQPHKPVLDARGDVLVCDWGSHQVVTYSAVSAPASLVISSVPSPQTASTPFTLTISAKDASGATVPVNVDVALGATIGRVSPVQAKLISGTASVPVSVDAAATGVVLWASAAGLVARSNAFSVVGPGPREGSLGGVVRDSDLKPVGGASVTLGQATRTTDAAGRYAFELQAAGRYSLSAAKDGASSPAMSVDVEPGVSKAVDLVFPADCNPGGLTPILLVPGIMGSSMLGGFYPSLPLDTPTWDDPRWPDWNLWSKVLDGNHLTAWGGLVDPVFSRVGWASLVSVLEGLSIPGTSARYRMGCNLFTAPYDWRLPVKTIANDFLKKQIDNAKATAGSTKVRIVAHSMGGLVARAYVEGLTSAGDTWPASVDVDRIAMVGTPNHGSAMSYFHWSGGDPRQADAVSGGLPIGELVSEALYTLYTGKVPVLYDTGLKVALRDLVQTKVKSIGDLLPSSAFLTQSGASRAMACDATTLISELNGATTTSRLGMPGDRSKVEAKVFAGSGFDTADQVKVSSADCARPLYRDGTPVGYGTTAVSMTSGDGTVTKESAKLDFVGYVTPELSAEHMNLVGAYRDDVIEFITGVRPSRPDGRSEPLLSAAAGRSLSISVLGRTQPLVTDPQGRATGVDPASGRIRQEIPGSSVSLQSGSSSVAISDVPDGVHSITLKGARSEDYQLVVDYAHDGTVSRKAFAGFNDPGRPFTVTATVDSARGVVDVSSAPPPPHRFWADRTASGQTVLRWEPRTDAAGAPYRVAVFTKRVEEPTLKLVVISTQTSYTSSDPWVDSSATPARVYAAASVDATGAVGFLGEFVQNDDRDHDGLSDVAEGLRGTDATKPDSDGDGLPDGEEVALGTDPVLGDSDGDGTSDPVEVHHGSDPLDPRSLPSGLLSLNQSRFLLSVAWRSYSDGSTGTGKPVSLTSDTGYFWFFQSSNMELVVKILDGRGVNGAFWVMYGALSDVEYSITISDTVTGAVRTYTNPAHNLASFADVLAFPAAAAQSTAGDPATDGLYGVLASQTLRERAATEEQASRVAEPPLCLNGDRFCASVTWWSYSDGAVGEGHPVALTSDSGTFWFFSPSNVELALKILDGRGVNGKFWVLFGALSDVEYTITITDMLTGAVRTYYNPPHKLASVADVTAFDGAGPAGAAVIVSPRSVDFGSVIVGQTSDRTLTLSNPGAATLAVASLGSSGVFSVVSPSAPFSVDAGGARQVVVRFAPSAAASTSGTLTIASNAQNQPVLGVPLTGSGVTALPKVEVSPLSLAFGKVTVGTAKDVSLTVRSTGTAPLVLSALSSSSAAFTVSGTSLPVSITPGAQVTVTVRFSPTAVGIVSSSLSVVTNASTVAVPLSGEGIAAGPVTEELAADDGTIEAGFPADGVFIVNRLTPGRYPATLASVRLLLAQYVGQPSPAGTQVRLVAFVDPTGSGNPAPGGVFAVDRIVTLPEVPGGVLGWVDFPISGGPVLTAGDLYVGFRPPSTPTGFGFPADMSPPMRSRAYSSPNGVTFQAPVTVDEGGTQVAVNVMIRAVVTIPSP